MASRPDTEPVEAERPPETEEIDEEAAEPSYESWDEFLRQSDLSRAYDTVIEIYSGSPYLDIDESVSLNGDELLPGPEAYDEEGESLEELRERLEGDTLVVAFGFDGRDLPFYQELNNPDMVDDGNWWDNPGELDVDYLLDDTSYTGAVNTSGFENSHLLDTERGNREVYLVSES